MEFSLPIYVGKAVPQGWRQARNIENENTISYELFNRLREHSKSISQVMSLNVGDFHCRFMILESETSSMIGTVEAALIRFYRPLWNTQVDGFGNHDPGKGRYNQARSEWDVLHPGRNWVEKCLGESPNPESIRKKIAQYLITISKQR